MEEMVRSSVMKRLLFTLTLALLYFSAGAWTTVYAAGKHPCAEEIARFCKDVKPGEGRLTRCLNEHAEEASAAYRKKMAEVKKLVDEAQQACAGDVTQAGNWASARRGALSAATRPCRPRM